MMSRRDYVPGRRCEKEQLITEDILTVLDMFDKELMPRGTVKDDTKPSPNGLESLSEATTVEEASAARRIVGEVQIGHAAPIVPLSPRANQTLTTTTTTSDQTPSLPSDASTTIKAIASTHTETVPASTKVEQQQQQRLLLKNSKNAEIPMSDRAQRPGKFPSPHSVDYELDTGLGISEKQSAEDIVDDVRRPQKQKISKDDVEQGVEEGQQLLGKANDAEQFESDKQLLPFLQEASTDVVQVFMEVMEDPDIPSERRRLEELHLLAVSYLNAHQLDEYNRWSTTRRKRIQSRERQLHNLSPRARDALRQLALTTDVRQARAQLRRIEPALRDELQSWGKSRERAVALVARAE
uniref:Global transcription activator SNF2L2 n=1 Tax=Globodera pallida TaxID=36090 RepID=A0A183C6C0_GLOPA